MVTAILSQTIYFARSLVYYRKYQFSCMDAIVQQRLEDQFPT